MLGHLVWFVLGILFWSAGVVTIVGSLVAWIVRAGGEPDEVPPEERVVPHLAGVVAVLWEWGCTFVLFVKLLVLGWIDWDPFPTSRGQGPAILLIHGYGMNRGVWWWFKGRLRRRGHTLVFTINLPFVGGEIDRYTELVRRRIEQLAPLVGERPWVLVGHSMGGLVARNLLRRYPELPVQRVVTLGSPHHGTMMAVLGIGEMARQMRPASPFLQELAAEDAAIRPRIFTVASRFDDLVVPWRSALLEGCESRVFDLLGHNALLLSIDVVETVAEQIERAAEAPPAATADGAT